MSESRKKSHNVLLSTPGKTPIKIEVFDAGSWHQHGGSDGAWRVRIDGKWHAPAGKYSFLGQATLGELLAGLVAGEDPAPPEPLPHLPWKAEVRIRHEDCPANGERAWVHAPPHREEDGRGYVWIWTGWRMLKLPVEQVTLVRVRK